MSKHVLLILFELPKQNLQFCFLPSRLARMMGSPTSKSNSYGTRSSSETLTSGTKLRSFVPIIIVVLFPQHS
jgi:hypothetical protein